MGGMIALLSVICVLQVADIISTVVALRRGCTELNPIARKLFGALGVVPASILAKLLGTVPMVAFAVLYPNYWMVPAAYAFLLVGLVVNNLTSIAAAGK